MSPRRPSIRGRILLALAALLPLLLFLEACTCGSPTNRPGAEAIVTGTVLDAATGIPVEGAHLEGPAGTRATSGSDGRFELTGLRERDEGEIVARTDDGRTGSVRVRPLAPGRLEVAVHLSRR
jgi:hypothetical protein